MSVTHTDLLPLSDADLLRQCDVQTRRGSGPGGQKRNKTESAVRLCHTPSGITVQSDDTRSQHKNRQKALTRLRERIALTLRCELDLAGWNPPEQLQLLLQGSIGRNSLDYLPAVAALLDLFVAVSCSVRDAAEKLGISTGALSRRLLADERLARAVNALRAERGMRLLK
jgi:hypothetical protein